MRGVSAPLGMVRVVLGPGATPKTGAPGTVVAVARTVVATVTAMVGTNADEAEDVGAAGRLTATAVDMAVAVSAFNLVHAAAICAPCVVGWNACPCMPHCSTCLLLICAGLCSMRDAWCRSLACSVADWCADMPLLLHLTLHAGYGVTWLSSFHLCYRWLQRWL